MTAHNDCSSQLSYIHYTITVYSHTTGIKKLYHPYNKTCVQIINNKTQFKSGGVGVTGGVAPPFAWLAPPFQL